MKDILVSAVSAGILSACAGMTGVFHAASTPTGQPSAQISPAGENNLLQQLICRPPQGYLDITAAQSILDASKSVVRRTGVIGHYTYEMTQGFMLQGVPVEYIEIMGDEETDAAAAVLAYSPSQTTKLRAVFNIKNQHHRRQLYSVLKSNGTPYATSATKLTAFGCAHD